MSARRIAAALPCLIAPSGCDETQTAPVVLPDAVADAGADATPDGATPPTLAFAADAPTRVLPGEQPRFGLTAAPEMQPTWTVTSATVDSLDCTAVFAPAADGAAVVLSVPPRIDDARCADVLTLVARLDDPAGAVEARHTFELDLPPGLGLRWRPYADGANPVVPLPTCPAWACLGHNDPTLARGADGRLSIWFAAGGDRGEFPVVGHAQQQADGAFAFAPDGPILEPADDGAGPEDRPWDYIRETVSVARADDGRWLLAYLGYATDYFTDPAIGLATAEDDAGRAFSRTPAPIYTPSRPGGWDANFITSPNLLRGSDGVWRLYYSGASVRAVGGRIGVLTSTDGVDWTPHADNPIFAPRPGQWDESVLDSYVAFVGGRYLMWYTAFVEPLAADTRIALGLAESEDGYRWQRVADGPILEPGVDGDWSSLQLAAGEVIVEADGSLLMAAYGVAREGPDPAFPDFRPERIGLFVSTPDE